MRVEYRVMAYYPITDVWRHYHDHTYPAPVYPHRETAEKMGRDAAAFWASQSGGEEPDLVEEPGAAGSSQRERSTIKFPYTDIRDAVTVAVALKDSYGSECETDQLAAALDQKSSSGSFRTKVATAAIFGVIETRRGTVALTDLGHEVADGHTREAALVKAFLNVPLYLALYNKFKGRSLPLGAGLEAEIKAQGVVPSQAERARQAFQRSAEHAGFLWSSKDRLVVPPSASINGSEGAPTPPSEREKGGDKNMANSPLLQGLWGMLPANGDFPTDERARWFKALAINLDLIYGDGQIVVKVEQPGSQQGSNATR